MSHTAPKRQSTVVRKTRETHIDVGLTLDGQGQASIDTGIGFLDHMLTAWAYHGAFDLTLTCRGDLHIDQHHTVEDCGIALGQAILEAVEPRTQLVRYGFWLLPMDEVLARVALDLSGRAYLHFEVPWHMQLGAGTYDYHLTREFFWGLVRAARMTLHVDVVTPGNNHHMCEAVFKGMGRALRGAVQIDPARPIGEIPSTKGEL
ncbi:MAG: imidazoleglycerol-phosphate dehydratase HisB [Myxococcota bacterium]